MNNRLNFENNNNELSFGVPKSKMSMNYNDSYNKPSINGVELKGNLTSEDLKLSGGSDIELITELKPESIEKDLEENQVYNGNAIHDLARLFGETIAGVEGSVEELEGKTIFDVSCTISLAEMEVSNVSSFSDEIIQKRDEGNLVRLNCTFVENPNLKVVCMLAVIDKNYVFFYPLIRGDIGAGMKNYLFRLGIGANSSSISTHELSEEQRINLITEFDIEGEYSEEDVYNANAILQLMGLFVDEITRIQKAVSENDDRLTALETVASELEVI